MPEKFDLLRLKMKCLTKYGKITKFDWIFDQVDRIWHNFQHETKVIKFGKMIEM